MVRFTLLCFCVYHDYEWPIVQKALEMRKECQMKMALSWAAQGSRLLHFFHLCTIIQSGELSGLPESIVSSYYFLFSFKKASYFFQF